MHAIITVTISKNTTQNNALFNGINQWKIILKEVTQKWTEIEKQRA